MTNFAQQELNEDVVDRDYQGTFFKELWVKCAEFDVQGLPFPEEYGGSGADNLTAMLTMEGLG